jgi:hypothetical protein
MASQFNAELAEGAEHAEKEGLALRAVVRSTQHDQTDPAAAGPISILSARSADLCGLCVE